jgi:hypothetical protein
MTNAMRRRVYRRAALAWRAGKPHQALEILADAGLQGEWSVFVRVAHRYAREHYLSRIESA